MQNLFSKIFCPYLTRSICFFFTLVSVSCPMAQTVIDELKAVSTGEVPLREQVFSETITTISTNRRVFITTNSNQKLIMGDFVSFIQNDNLVLRALVVKTRDDKSGLKIVKIYQSNGWSGLQPGQNINILRGDDSYYLNQLNKERASVFNSEKNDSENYDAKDQTFSNDEKALLSDSFSMQDSMPSDGRKIKSNHMLYLAIGQYRSLGVSGGSSSYLHYRGGWSFQFANNWWTDLSYGHSLIKKYPAPDIDTSLNVFTGKVGYMFTLPIHSFLYLYGGSYTAIASSPGAGEGNISATTSQQETEMVRDLEGTGFLFGAAYFKRLVPGWTFRLDLDTKQAAAGIMAEF